MPKEGSMRAFTGHKIFFALLIFLAACALGAGPAHSDCILDFSGTVTYDIDSGQVAVSVQKINNTSCGKAFITADGYVASMGISLWATTAPYAGEGDISGYVLCDLPAGELEEAQLVTGFLKGDEYVPPPAGTYYLTIVLVELTGNGGVQTSEMRDYYTFTQPKELGSKNDKASASEEAPYNPMPRETGGMDPVSTESKGGSGGCFVKSLP